MKIAITGKGGVGKTTLSSLLIQHIAGNGKRVIAIDADPDSNLASALGFRDIEKITPISEMEELIEERTGAKPGASGGIFKINPKVDDLPEKLWLEKGNIRLMVMGTVKSGGSGCVCPEHALLKNLVSHLVFYRDEVLVMDMEAGIEHIGRGTAGNVDMFIMVVEPGKRSIETAHNIKKLVSDLGIKKVGIVGSKIRNEKDREYIKDKLKDEDIRILGFIPYNEGLIEADMEGEAVPLFLKDNIDEIIENIALRE
jgi:CO dehydrogenase maturation factor